MRSVLSRPYILLTYYSALCLLGRQRQLFVADLELAAHADRILVVQDSASEMEEGLE